MVILPRTLSPVFVLQKLSHKSHVQIFCEHKSKILKKYNRVQYRDVYIHIFTIPHNLCVLGSFRTGCKVFYRTRSHNVKYVHNISIRRTFQREMNYFSILSKIRTYAFTIRYRMQHDLLYHNHSFT